MMEHSLVIVQLSSNHEYSYGLVGNVGGWSPDLEQAPYGIIPQTGSWTKFISGCSILRDDRIRYK